MNRKLAKWATAAAFGGPACRKGVEDASLSGNLAVSGARTAEKFHLLLLRPCHSLEVSTQLARAQIFDRAYGT